MAYLTPTSFRVASLDEACQGLMLTPEEANDTRLTAAIADLSQDFDDLTNDHFETRGTAVVYEIDVADCSDVLELPERCMAIAAVKTRDTAGVLTTQGATAFRLHSSLDSTGSRRLGDRDYLKLVGPPGTSLTSVIYGPYTWPEGPQAVQVTGTFGWTVTPGKAKRGVALMVWDRFKAQGDILRRAQRFSANGTNVEMSTTDTGLLELDGIVRNLKRHGYDGSDEHMVFVG